MVYQSTTQYDAFQVSNDTRARLKDYSLVESPDGCWEGFYVVTRTDTGMIVAVLADTDFALQYETVPPPVDPAP